MTDKPMVLTPQELALEVWRPVPGFPKYEVSNMGRVKSLRFNRVMCHGRNDRRYHTVTLVENKIPKPCRVHRLVALAFLGEPNGLTVNHIDENKDNNRLSNLEYVTHRQNFVHSVKKNNGLPVGVGKQLTRYYARFYANGKRTRSGSFDTVEEAHEYYLKHTGENP